MRIDVKTNHVTKRIDVAKPDWITASPDALWVSSQTGEIIRVDPTTATVVAKIRVGANPLGTAWIKNELWVPNIDDGTISIVDPAQNAVRTTLAAGKGPLSIGAAAGDAWISNSEDGELWRVSTSQ